MLGVGDVYAFGMAHGHTLPMFRKLLPEPTRIFGFDSFRGLPAEDDERSKMPGWKPGAFKPKHSIWVTPERLEQSAGGRPRAVITPGFFDKTLTSQLVVQQNMSRALYVDIDCDLHSSTVTVLDWLLHHKIMQLGTLIGYDDWWVISCNNFRVSNHSTVLNPLDVGEGKAHLELTMKFGLRFTCVGGPCKPPPTTKSCHPNNHFAPIFMLSAIGVPKGQEDAGFDFRPDQLSEYMAASQACAAVKDM